MQGAILEWLLGDLPAADLLDLLATGEYSLLDGGSATMERPILDADADTLMMQSSIKQNGTKFS
jgi:hypothetical protein